jgi:hypothetical protein
VGRINYRVGRLSAGTLTWECGGRSSAASELSTTRNTYSSIGALADPDPDPAFSDGDQIVIEFYLDDASSATMAANYTVSHWLGSAFYWCYNSNTPITFQDWPSGDTPTDYLTPMRGVW